MVPATFESTTFESPASDESVTAERAIASSPTYPAVNAAENYIDAVPVGGGAPISGGSGGDGNSDYYNAGYAVNASECRRCCR